MEHLVKHSDKIDRLIDTHDRRLDGLELRNATLKGAWKAIGIVGGIITALVGVAYTAIKVVQLL